MSWRAGLIIIAVNVAAGMGVLVGLYVGTHLN